ncbi:hypothetical protein HX021_16390 [Sphingobacterium sp. N143]|uniref:hypothetical protein n=1 Tax=Sphingobacterium sp. N143 TaxID=2746727 RepID=UPI002578A2D2|nr:hypothetical protein [Sphingobacterium sp. N143]MDM1295870.1 hypothetical protein [Sphingobacterium sp. N143]
MKKIFNKIGQVLQLVLVAPVKLPGKVGNVLKYLALGLGIIETVLDEAREQPELQEDLNLKDNAKLKEISPDAVYKDPEKLMQEERSEANESE